MQNEKNSSRAGYCLRHTRKRLSWCLWGLLCLVIALCLGSVFAVGLDMDRAYWDTMDYVTLAVSGGGTVLLTILGLWLCYVAVRDAFFPEKSSLAQSIRRQLPYPEEAPPAEELFAMVDRDLEEHARWFGPVGIGREWVLGDGANRIDRIRGIFVINQLHQHHTETGVRTRREMELVLIDDRWQRTGTSFQDLRDLQAAADCLALRVPEARRGVNGQSIDFWTMDESAREDFERNFQQRKSLRISEETRQEALRGEPQNMILRRDGEVTSRVDPSLVQEALTRCLAEGGSFALVPTHPIPQEDRLCRELRASAQDGRIALLLVFAPAAGGADLGLTHTATELQALEILTGWLRRQAPDAAAWTPCKVYARDNRRPVAPPRQDSRSKLALVRANGLSETHTTFTGEDVAVAAEGLVDGTYREVELTHSVGYLWIRVTAGDRTDGRCTVEATRPDADTLRFFRTRMTARQAAAWLLGYPTGEYLPGGGDWKDYTKQVK